VVERRKTISLDYSIRTMHKKRFNKWSFIEAKKGKFWARIGLGTISEASIP